MNVVTITVPPSRGRRGKKWAKLVTGIDRAQRGGYAILGEFTGGTLGVRSGTIVLCYGLDLSSRGNVAGHCVDIYRVGESGDLTRVDGGDYGSDWVAPTLDQLEGLLPEPVQVELTNDERRLCDELAALQPDRRRAVIEAAEQR